MCSVATANSKKKKKKHTNVHILYRREGQSEVVQVQNEVMYT